MFTYLAHVIWYDCDERVETINIGYCDSFVDAVNQIENKLFDDIDKIEIELFDTLLNFPVEAKDKLREYMSGQID